MTREDINDIINVICPNDEDYEKPCISPKYLRQELEQLALDQKQWNGESTTTNYLRIEFISKEDAKKVIIDHQYSNDFCEEHNIDHSINTSMALIALSDLPSVIPQELITDKINKMKSEIADSLEFWDYSPNNNPLARDILETLTNFWGDIKTETENI